MRSENAVFALLIALTLGCDDTGRGRSADAAVQPWQLELRARIGSVDDPDLGLTRVTQVAFGPRDRLFIAQSTEHEVRAYDLDGGLLHRIGGDGEGPGEFRTIAAIGWMHDTLFVTDGALRRFSVFDADGRYIQSFQWTSVAEGVPRPPVFYIPSGPQVVLDDGTALLQQGFGYVPGEAERLSVPWLRIDRDGMQDTIAVQSYATPAMQRLAAQGSEVWISAPISDAPLYQLMVDASGLAIIERSFPQSADPHVFRLIRIDPEGDTVLTREYPYTPVPTPAGELERQVDAHMERYARSATPPSRESITRILSQPAFIPPYLPPVTLVRTGQDGSVWIQRERAGRDSVAWNAIDRSGDMAGEVWLPSEARIMAATAEHIAVLEPDELDVPYVLVYRVLRPDEHDRR